MDAFQDMPLRVSLALVVLAALCIPAYAETPAPVTVPATQATAQRLAAEREFWASLKESGDPADIRAYLEQFPGGMFGALARNWLELLGEEARPQAAQVAAAPAVPTPEATPGASFTLSPWKRYSV